MSNGRGRLEIGLETIREIANPKNEGVALQIAFGVMLGYHAMNVSKSLRDLEKEGLVQSVQKSKYRKRWRLTPKGVQALNKIEELHKLTPSLWNDYYCWK